MIKKIKKNEILFVNGAGYCQCYDTVSKMPVGNFSKFSSVIECSLFCVNKGCASDYYNEDRELIYPSTRWDVNG